MTAPPRVTDPTVPLEGLRVGDLLAEGGEGRVFELPRQPHLVFKAYRHPARREFLEDLVAWPAHCAPSELAPWVEAASAWPTSVVVDGEGAATGLLIPRAPRRFALRHRDGTTRLASLSYLTADPAHRAVAYGLELPGEVSPARIGVVYALARLLQAFESGAPAVAHGDLSAKNVLWSLQRGPEVFVIDCDNCDWFGPGGEPLGPDDRRRAMTPNWEDPAVPGGTNPIQASDRYSLALIFLRVVGAANFPVQSRQRQDPCITIDFAVPSPLFRHPLLAPGAPVWDLCARGLSVSQPDGRPLAADWVAALEAVLDSLGAADVMRSVWLAQGGGRPSPSANLPAAGPGDVIIRPVPAAPRPAPRPAVVPVDSPAMLPWHRPAALVAPPDPGPAPSPFLPVAAVQLRKAISWWLGLHRRTLADLASRSHRGSGVRALGLCAIVDVVVGLIALFAVAMIVSPVLGL